MPKPRTPADLAVAQATAPEPSPHRLQDPLTDLLKRLFAFCPATRLVCRPAWELTGITCVDRYDVAPWLFF